MKLLRAIDLVLLKIQKVVLIFSTGMVILFMCIGIVMRYFFKLNFNGMEELLLILGFWIYFFGGSVAFRDNDHMEASILLPRLKTERSRTIYMAVRSVVSIPILFVVTVWAAQYVWWSFKFWPTTLVYNIPDVVSQVPLLMCFFLATFYTAAHLVRSIVWLKKDREEGELNK